MTAQEPVSQPAELPAGEPAVPQGRTYQPDYESDEWREGPDEELPRRPRGRLLSPLPLALLGVLLTACGFIGGVLVEKGQTSSSSSAGGSGLASRFAALRSAASGSGASGAAGAAGAAGPGAAAGGFSRPTAGTVAYLDGSTLYVTNSEGNTVKVITSDATAVSKTVKASVKDIRPGETVTVRGSTGSGGAITAETLTVGSSGSGLAGLFGGSSSGSSSSGASSSGGTQSLFGGG